MNYITAGWLGHLPNGEIRRLPNGEIPPYGVSPDGWLQMGKLVFDF